MLCHDHDRFNEPLRFAGYEPNVDVELHNDPQYDIGTLQRMNVRA